MAVVVITKRIFWLRPARIFGRAGSLLLNPHGKCFEVPKQIRATLCLALCYTL